MKYSPASVVTGRLVKVATTSHTMDAQDQAGYHETEEEKHHVQPCVWS